MQVTADKQQQELSGRVKKVQEQCKQKLREVHNGYLQGAACSACRRQPTGMHFADGEARRAKQVETWPAGLRLLTLPVQPRRSTRSCWRSRPTWRRTTRSWCRSTRRRRSASLASRL